MFWLAPNTCMCSMFSVTHDMQEHFKTSSLYSSMLTYHRNQVFILPRKEGEIITFDYYVLFVFFRNLHSEMSCLLNNRKTTSVLSQRNPCCVGNRHTQCQEVIVAFVDFFLCPAICTVLPIAVRTLQDQKNKVKHFQNIFHVVYTLCSLGSTKQEYVQKVLEAHIY